MTDFIVKCIPAYFIIGLINVTLCGLNGWLANYKRNDFHLEVPVAVGIFFEFVSWPSSLRINIAWLFRKPFDKE